MRKLFSAVLPALLVFFTLPSKSQQSDALSVYHRLNKLNTLGRVLYIAAHPDDENTRLLSYYAREKHFRTAYLSVTRGDGGQNLIGTEQGDLLGVIRTQELLAARSVDKAEQFFTRAIDFGYSKTPEETFGIWNRDSILSDMVWVIRNFKPDVIIMRFPANGAGGHGHHTASALLAMSAFRASADPTMFPEQLKLTGTWQAKRIFWNVFRPKDDDLKGPGVVSVDIGTYNFLEGKSYGEIASESRSMHKSQGFGAARSRGTQPDYLKLMDGDSLTKSEFDGIDITWNSIEGGKEIAKQLSDIIAMYNPVKPSGIIPSLINVRKSIAKLKDDYWREIKLRETDELILACAGIFAEGLAENYSVVPGSKMKITAAIISRSDVPVTISRIVFPGGTDTTTTTPQERNTMTTASAEFTVPADAEYSVPYWLKEEKSGGLFSTTDQKMRGVPEAAPNFSVEFTISIGGEQIKFSRPVRFKWVDPVRGELYRDVEVVPAVSINYPGDALLFQNNQPKQVTVSVRAGADSVSGNLETFVSKGAFKIEPADYPFAFAKKNDEQQFTFTLTPVRSAAEDEFTVFAMSGDDTLRHSLTRIEYDHIPPQVLVRPDRMKLTKKDIATPELLVGYIEGAGDEIPASLRMMGYKVDVLTDRQLTSGQLGQYDVIITGIRAYNTNDRMPVYQSRLMKYVENGGTLLVQYNTSNFISTLKTDIGPYPFKITRERVTEEDAAITFVAPESPLLNYPNKITAEDFSGWVQERGIYFAGDYGKEYEEILSMHDKGQEAHKGSLIVANHGKGKFIYTGLAFFRQLPAGVPGAYKLFINLMSAGKSGNLINGGR